jgi:hypothetical protein
MNATIEVLLAEAKRLRSLADRMDAFALELNGKAPPEVGLPGHTPKYGHGTESEGQPVVLPRFLQEFRGMTQHAAILKALELYGPQTTRELFARLNSGGMAFRKPVYVASILGRLKDVVERTPDNKIKLKTKDLTVKLVP